MAPAGATRALEVLGEAFVGIQDAPDPRITLEVALVRLTRPDAELSLSALADRIGRLERGAPAASTPTASTAQPGDSARAPACSMSPDSQEVAPPTPEPAPTTAPPLDTTRGSGTGNAADAREALKQSRPPTGARAATKPGATKSAPERGAPRKASPTKAAAPAPTPTPAPAAAPATGELPTRDEIVLAWGDTVLPSLPAKAKSRFSPGPIPTRGRRRRRVRTAQQDPRREVRRGAR